MVKAFVIEQSAMPIIDAAIVDTGWFDKFELPPNHDRLKRVELNGIVYILSNTATEESGFVAINCSTGGVFSGPSSPQSVLERVLRVGMRHYDRSVVIPHQWHKFHCGSLLSVFSEPHAAGNYERIVFDQSPKGTDFIYAACTTQGDVDLAELSLDLRLFQEAHDGFIDAILSEDEVVPFQSVGQYGILLSAPLGTQLATQGTLSEWYDHKLNPDQIKFVDCPPKAPARLRGIAGSGKTQAMAVKCLRDLYRDADQNGDKSFAFLTHSAQLAHEVVSGMFYAMDPSGRWDSLETQSGKKKLWIGTIYELALEKLNYQRSGIRPLDTDGRAGREYQKILVADALGRTFSQPRIALGPLKQASDILDRFEKAETRDALVSDVLAEFACVLDAEKVRKGTAAGNHYLFGRREAWQMELHNDAGREIMLEAYTEYRSLLRNHKVLSLDQMIVDFDQYLLSYEWNELRDSEGFDAIFVDEYHYFSRVETMTLQHLFKTRSEYDGKLPLFMSYDLKQGVSDTGLGVGMERFRNPGVGTSDAIDLNTVYRSSPQITEFLVDIDGAFPALDLEGEYRTYEASSEVKGGDVPILHICDSNIEMIDQATALGVNLAKKSINGGRDVAILCMNEKLFDTYRVAGRNEGRIVSMVSRGDLRQLRYAKNRCVFSMPEYVAGLQFDTVILIHVDEVDLSSEYPSQGERRRFVSRLYLGASRAESNLHIFSSNERQGASKILNASLNRGSLQKQN